MDNFPKIPDREPDLSWPSAWDSLYVWVNEMVELVINGDGITIKSHIRFVDDKVQSYESGLGRWIDYKSTQFAKREKEIMDYIVENILLGADDV